MIYDLWDIVSGNIVDTVNTKDDALAVVREALADRGAAFVAATLSLGQMDARGRLKVVAEGQALVEIARADAGVSPVRAADD